MPANTVDELVNALKSSDDKIRGDAWLNAAPLGADAVTPLATLMTDADFEVARAARRALWKIIRHAGRPEAEDEQKAVVNKLNGLLTHNQPAAVCSEVLWMLSEIGDDTSVEPIAALLSDEAHREDARMALQQIPGKKSLSALQTAFSALPDDFNFKANLAQSLRNRGVVIFDIPIQKLIPTKQTKVKKTSKPAG